MQQQPVVTLFVALGGLTSLLIKLALERANAQKNPPFRRWLAKTEPVPYAIWMTGLGAIFGFPIFLLVWAVSPSGAFSQILFRLLLFPCFGLFMGLYVTQYMKLPWLATFGDVLKGSAPIPPEDIAKNKSRQSALAVVFMVAILSTSIALAYGMGIF
jgi:hypothetical protein